MPLHLTKIAFGNPTVDQLAERLRQRAVGGEVALVTRYQPKRFAEIAGQGSLFWIAKHQLVGRSPIVGFGEAEDGRVAIRLEPRLILVVPRRKRAHQGWRYLEDEAAPADLVGEAAGTEAMPAGMQGALAELGLL